MSLKRTWKKVGVTVETHEFIVALEAARSVLSYCPQCATQVNMLSAEQAARLTDVGLGTIDQWVKAGKVHCTELNMGERLICINSLAAEAPIQPRGAEHKNAACSSGARNQKGDLP
jgi:hypothetical protein